MIDGFAWLERLAWGATVIAVIVGVVTVRAAYLQRRRQFETIYVQRYWTLIDKLSLEALRGRAQPQIRVIDQQIVRSYLRLCEDELELRKAGWITSDTWEIWETGIRAQLKRWPFCQVWREVNCETGPERPIDAIEEFTLLRTFLLDGEDPLENASLRKRLRQRISRMLGGGP
jgi:hypothetical protein